MASIESTPHVHLIVDGDIVKPLPGVRSGKIRQALPTILRRLKVQAEGLVGELTVAGQSARINQVAVDDADAGVLNAHRQIGPLLIINRQHLWERCL